MKVSKLDESVWMKVSWMKSCLDVSLDEIDFG